MSPSRSSSSSVQARTPPPPTWNSLHNFLTPHGPRRRAHIRRPSDLSVALSSTSDTNLPPFSDVDLGFTLDHESGLTTTFDGHGDFDTAFEADLGQASMNNSNLITTEPNGIGSVSNHTSRTSTVIGDEVETQGSSLLDSTFNDVQHGTESQGDRDEIDWENDGDETEEQPPVAQSQTTNSPSGKRTRTNEPESLDEEAGML